MSRIKNIIFIIKILLRLPLDFLKNNKISIYARLSTNVKISNSCIDKYCYIANNTNINNSVIKKYCSIAPGVQIGGMEHSHWMYSTSTFISDKCVSNKVTIIEEDVWIAAGSVIKQGVKIGRGSVVGAMSFVNTDVPPNSIVVGIPAKIIRKRMKDYLFDKLVESNYWSLSPKKARKILNKI